jgi:hypothetical protein
MAALTRCPRCARHHKHAEHACPFCKVPLAAVALVAAGVAIASCARSQPEIVALYGAPPTAVPAPSDAGPPPDAGST